MSAPFHPYLCGRNAAEWLINMISEELLSSEVYDGENKMTVEALYNRMGSEEFDFEKYKNGGMLEEIIRLSEAYLRHSKPEEMMCPETVEYWKGMGLRKEYVTDSGGDYVIFVPTELEEGKKYPLIFTVCGDNANLYFVETLGFTQLAAEEKIIQVIPMFHRPGTGLDQMNKDRPCDLLDSLIEKYPVDESRIYMSGFSHGGILSQWNGIAHFDRFAGICCSGIRPGDGAKKRVAPSFMVFYDFSVTEEVKKAHVPVVYCIGMAEQPEHLPLYHENHKPLFEHYIDEHVYMLKTITDMNETPELTEEDLLKCASSENICERVFGIPLQNTRVEEYFGAKHYFGEVPSADGVVRTRYIAVENQPHHPSAAWARLSWEFIKKFRRDPDTHASIKED